MGTLSNEALSDLTGCSRAYVYGIMSGTKHPEKDMLLRMAFALGMELPETQAMLKIEKSPSSLSRTSGTCTS